MKKHGAVAAGHEVTARAAARVLDDGGNAFDAVVAAMWAACVAEPVLASLGGGGFVMARPAGEPPRLYDFFVETPLEKRSREDLEFESRLATFAGGVTQEFHAGYGSVATPGVVAGLFAEAGTRNPQLPLPSKVHCSYQPRVYDGLDGGLLTTPVLPILSDTRILLRLQTHHGQPILAGDGDHLLFIIP